MARIPLSPPMNVEGLFKVNSPFTLPENVIFRVEADRNFADLIRAKTNPFTAYYEPVGLTEAEYNDDADVGASIITLKSRDGQVVFIPNTYIQSYPGAAGTPYVRNVIILDLALVPDYVDVKAVQDDVVDVVKKLVGVNITPVITTLAYEGVVTDEQHLQMEAARKALIRETIPLSEQNAILTARNAELQALVDQLKTIIGSQGEATTP